MIALKKIQGPYGIPVYYQRMPDMIKSVSMAWVMHTGAADDTTIGAPGLHHWFEHVPFRGTKKYPRGAIDIGGPFTSMSGHVNAYTDTTSTCFNGHFHITQWKKGLETITDLVSAPLITDEGVEAERRVIHQEISGHLASIGKRTICDTYKMLYPGHPYGNSTLGDETSLSTMDAQTLRTAHKHGYDRSRASFFFVGNVEESHVMSMIETVAENMPDNSLTERRRAHFYGDLPAWKLGHQVVETEFPTSVIKMLFPLRRNNGNEIEILGNTMLCQCLDGMFECGGLTAPLGRIVREERQLVYGSHTSWCTFSGGGHYGFTAKAKSENIEAIITAYSDVIKDPSLKSASRLSDVKSAIIAAYEMNSVDTHEYMMGGIRMLNMTAGIFTSEADFLQAFHAVSIEDIQKMLSILDPEKARVIVFKGMGS